jgi:hypothetical protein
MQSRSKIRQIWRTSFYIDGCGTLRTVALRRPIFQQKKRPTTISSGLNYCSLGSSHSQSCDTVPMKFNIKKKYRYRYWVPVIMLILCYLEVLQGFTSSLSASTTSKSSKKRSLKYKILLIKILFPPNSLNQF